MCVSHRCVAQLEKHTHPFSLIVMQIKMHLMDPFQERQRGQAREPKWREMMQQLEAEVAVFGGWESVTSVKVEGKNAYEEFEV